MLPVLIWSRSMARSGWTATVTKRSFPLAGAGMAVWYWGFTRPAATALCPAISACSSRRFLPQRFLFLRDWDAQFPQEVYDASRRYGPAAPSVSALGAGNRRGVGVFGDQWGERAGGNRNWPGCCARGCRACAGSSSTATGSRPTWCLGNRSARFGAAKKLPTCCAASRSAFPPVRSTRSTGSRRRFYMGLRRGMRSLPERKPYWICIAEQVR